MRNSSAEQRKKLADSSVDMPVTNLQPLPPARSLTVPQRCRQIELLLLDVDGVLTDGRIVYTDNGVEIKAFHVRDGSGLKMWQGEGKRAGIITGRRSDVVEVRAAELGLDPVVQGVADKLAAFKTILAQTGLRREQTAYIGDDLPDLPVLCRCGLAVAVADACPEVTAHAHYVTRAAGGCGAVREAIELILRAQGRWQHLVEQLLMAKAERG
jgi:3-deoxy-D-manno-octulosonate 8-phosphate phosphatase (KDO 8-P phosphatase)